MIETLKFDCPYCGTTYQTVFSVPDYEVAKSYMNPKYLPHMNSIYCRHCKIWFQRGISVLHETFGFGDDMN